MLSFFRSSKTTKQSEGLFRKELNLSSFPITLQPKFAQVFKDQFFPINVTTKAVNKLEGALYYQESQTVEECLDLFQTLISEASYTDFQTIVVKFHYRLRITIQNQIVTLPVGHPEDTNPLAQFEAMRCIDQAQQANQAF